MRENIFKIYSSLIIFCLSFLTVNAQNNFKGIIPFVTTKEEVEKKIGKPDKFGRYEFKEGRVYIFYRENKCPDEREDCFCLAPLGTVLKISIQPYYALYIKKLRLNPKLFKYSEVKSHVNGISVFSNTRHGILYEVQEGKVIGIDYYESEKTCKILKQKLVNN